jgi:hypothetical protein
MRYLDGYAFIGAEVDRAKGCRRAGLINDGVNAVVVELVARIN